jgi:hypothetical protein
MGYRSSSGRCAPSRHPAEDHPQVLIIALQPKDGAIKEALSLLGAAGFASDKPLKFTISGSSTNAYQSAMVQLAQAQFKRNSHGAVDPDIKLFGSTEWTSVRSNSTFEYFVGGQQLRWCRPRCLLQQHL